MADAMTDSPPFDDREARFVEIIAQGGTWRSAAVELKTSTATFAKWLADPERVGLQKQYARALEAQGDDAAFRVVEIAERTDIDAAEKRVRMDAYKWLAGKRKPKVYGDKIDLTHGGDPDRPVVQRIERVIVRPNPTDQNGSGL